MAIYPDDGSGDPDAEPGVSPEADIEADALSVTLEVFAIRPDKQGGTAYTWLSGPNPRYGFGLSPTQNLSLDEHRDNIRGFLVDIDPATTGYLSEN